MSTEESAAALQSGQNVAPGGDHVQEEGKKKGKAEGAQKIIDFVLPRVALFHSPDGKAYVRYRSAAHYENHAVDSKQFRMMTMNLVRHELRFTPSRSVMDTVIAAIEAAAITQYEERRVYYRYAHVDDASYIDLGNDKWDAVCVRAEGWAIVAEPPVRFVRHKNMAAMPYPSQAPDLRKLRKLINVACEEDWILVAVWLIAAMSGIGPYAILLLLGPQGSAKSTAARLLRQMIDPVVKAPLRSLWRNDWDLAIAASRYAVLAFDNISKITAEQSDAACRLATGSGFATRELWTKDEETVFDGMRPLIFNGISEFATRPDLLERCLIIVLSPIPAHERRTLMEVNAEFEQHWPDIFAGILVALSAVLKNLSTAQATVHELPRMADFALVGIAAEPACPWEPGAFLKAYKANQSQGQAIALEGDAFAQIMLNFADDLPWQKNEQWNGTATELLAQLKGRQDFDDRDLPSTPAALSGQLRRLQSVLEAQGLYVAFDRKGAGGTRNITLSNKPLASEKAAGD